MGERAVSEDEHTEGRDQPGKGFPQAWVPLFKSLLQQPYIAFTSKYSIIYYYFYFLLVLLLLFKNIIKLMAARNKQEAT
jgi:hypothetical protein